MIKRDSEVGEEESPVLVLPQDPERLAQLQRKLEEYKEQLLKSRATDPYKPEFAFEHHYRIKVLETLFEQGSVDSWSFSRQVASKFGADSPAFAWTLNALGVIDDYIQTGGINT